VVGATFTALSHPHSNTNKSCGKTKYTEALGINRIIKSFKNPSCPVKNKKPFSKGQRAGNGLPGQDDYRTFCMSDETEKVYRKLEEVIGIC